MSNHTGIGMRPAVFLDRDGTVIEHVHLLTEPSQVRLIPGAADAIRNLQALDYACIIVTNQSVIGRGLLSEAGLTLVHNEMHRQLAGHGVRLDGVFFCPAAPTTTDRTVIEHHDRKPGPGMLQKASRELLLDLTRSWIVGDMHSDMLAGRNAGLRGTILVRTGQGDKVDPNDPSVDYAATDLLEASRLIARLEIPVKTK
ncbi:MAG TPA: HAD family hydrolase [Tepidisphaeraceae bacterium]|nr:HAD family hydrolase [Tepidisphaeraceae bacterium]